MAAGHAAFARDSDMAMRVVSVREFVVRYQIVEPDGRKASATALELCRPDAGNTGTGLPFTTVQRAVESCLARASENGANGVPAPTRCAERTPIHIIGGRPASGQCPFDRGAPPRDSRLFIGRGVRAWRASGFERIRRNGEFVPQEAAVPRSNARSASSICLNALHRGCISRLRQSRTRVAAFADRAVPSTHHRTRRNMTKVVNHPCEDISGDGRESAL